MSGFAVALILASTFMHAGWNLLARRQRRETVFCLRLLIAIVIIGFVPALVSEALTRSLTAKAWVCVVISGFCCAVYFFGLARAYGASDFTVVYPVARSLPVLLVGLGDVARGRYPTPIGWLGMVLVVLGCLFTPLRSFRELALRRYVNRAVGWMLLTAVGTVGYTMSDKLASEVVTPGPATAARYGYVFFLVSLAVYAALLRIFGTGDEKNSEPLGWKVPTLAGCLNFGAYWLVLWAYQLARRASYITALRQFSIVIGVVLAVAIYKERPYPVRVTGILLIILGLVLVSFLGG